MGTHAGGSRAEKVTTDEPRSPAYVYAMRKADHALFW